VKRRSRVGTFLLGHPGAARKSFTSIKSMVKKEILRTQMVTMDGTVGFGFLEDDSGRGTV
jgi:hypothetical protein